MKENTIRIIALVFSLLLVLVYVFLPTQEIWKQENNSGREKLEISAGDEYSWSWTQTEARCSAVSIRLSGSQKAPDLILNLSLKDENGREAASVRQKLSDLEKEAGGIVLHGQFKHGTVYTISILAEGNGKVKLRGESADDSEAFEPALIAECSKDLRNPVLLYFAVGALLAALTPVRGKETEPSHITQIQEKESPVSRILPWLTFLLIATLGIYITLRRPMYNTLEDWRTWDEDTHWEIVQQMGFFRFGGFRRVAYDLITWAPGYAPLAVGYSLGQIFTSNEEILYRSGIACSTVCYAGMCALAVKHTPRYKTSFLTAGTMPVIIFMMTSMTYDTVVIGSILLGIALLLETLDRGGRISPLRAITMVSLMAFGTVAKPAYSILLLTLFMIPASQFGGKKKARIFKLFVALMMLWCFAAMTMPGAYEDVIEGDWRFEGASVSGQIAWIRANPVEGGLRPLSFVLYFWRGLMIGDIAHWGYLGNNVQAVNYYLCLLLLASPLCTAGEAWNQNSMLTFRRRSGFAITGFAAVVIIAYAQFLASTPVGGYVQGMQARYCIPIWIVMLMSVMWPQAIRRRMGKIGEWAPLVIWMACFIFNLQNMMRYIITYGT